MWHLINLRFSGRKSFALFSSGILAASSLLIFSLLLPLFAGRVRADDAAHGVVYLPAMMAKSSVQVPRCGVIRVVNSDIDRSTTWVPSNLYVIEDELVVKSGVTLKIEPGTVLKFKNDAGLDIQGKLTAVGTQQSPVYFTSIKDDSVCGDTNNDGSASAPDSGDWNALTFLEKSDQSSSVRYAVVSYGGIDDYPYGAPLRLVNVTPQIDSISFKDNYRNAAQLVGPSWTTNTLDSTTVIYLIDNEFLDVPQNNILTILPGVKIKLESDGYPGTGIWIAGKLTADGTRANPIVFTSDKDDTVCGRGAAGEAVCDTNNDRTASAPNAGDWDSISFFEESSPTSSLTNAVVRHGGVSGKYSGSPIRIFNVVPTLENLSIEDSFHNSVGLITQGWTSHILNSQTVIYAIDSGYNTNNALEVLAGNTLVVLPGVKIKLSEGGMIEVNGTLKANGTLDEPIFFTSDKDDMVCGTGVSGEPICDTNNDGTASAPAAKDWQWIEFPASSSPGSSITYGVVRYGGSSAWGKPTGAPIRLFNSMPQLDNISFEDNYRNAVQLAGDGWTSHTLASKTVIYWVLSENTVSGPQKVLKNNTLTLEPGTKIKLETTYSRVGALRIEGVLQAVGTFLERVTFTSVKDDTVCGRGAADERICDTNNDGSATAPSGGDDWTSIIFPAGSDSGSLIRYATIRYGGITTNNPYGDDPYESAVLIEDSSPSIDTSSFADNYGAVIFSGLASPTMDCNDVSGNAFGFLNRSTTHVINARNHWWGSGSGPTTPTNPGGTGDTVSNYIDYLPWSATPCSLIFAP